MATRADPFTRYEQRVMRTAAIASKATATPILTHNEGVDGDLQPGFLADQGIAAKNVIVGHSCTNRLTTIIAALSTPARSSASIASASSASGRTRVGPSRWRS